MTPAARLGAAIDILDRYLTGEPAEKVLTNWARKSRYAGSKDRAAVRDIVFQCVRCRSSYAYIGGSETGRGLAVGYAASFVDDGADLFNGTGYGPETLNEGEVKAFTVKAVDADPHITLDVPEWTLPLLKDALGSDLGEALSKLQTRAPVFVRVNLSKASLTQAIASLATDQIKANPHDLCVTALEITENPRRLNGCDALRDGLIELQDAASQAVCATLPSGDTLRILDYCAGGGGKALAMADRPHGKIYSHDINQNRMGDIEQRADRAGAKIMTLKTSEVAKNAPFDLVLCDVPCSGSGAWRRAPDGKWNLTRGTLDNLLEKQNSILKDAAKLVATGGTLAYATCSLLREENEDQIARFLTECPEWSVGFSKRFSPLDGGDGFFIAHLMR